MRQKQLCKRQLTGPVIAFHGCKMSFDQLGACYCDIEA